MAFSQSHKRMPNDTILGAGVPDTSATAGTEPTVDTTGQQVDPVVPPVEGTQISEETKPPTEQTPPQEDIDLTELAAERPDDSELVKKLRGVLKQKLPTTTQEPQETTLDEGVQKKIDLVNKLYSLDLETGQPTAKAFVENLHKESPTIAGQLLYDLTTLNVEKPGVNGWTLGHELLERIGLDPYKLDELKAYSKGEIAPPQGLVDVVPNYIPSEYREAYKRLNQVTKMDVDAYLGPNGTEDQRAAALSTLSDKQRFLEHETAQQQAQETAQREFETSVYTESENQVNSSYEGLLKAVATSDAFTQVKVSADPLVDSSIKNTLLSQITALGDPRSLLAKQAHESFTSLGIEVKIDEISKLMQEVETQTIAAVKADKIGKTRGEDYTIQINEALNRRTAAIRKLTGMANGLFSQALSKIAQKPVADPTGGVPTFDGTTPSTVQRTPGTMTEKELDAMIAGVASSLSQGAS